VEQRDKQTGKIIMQPIRMAA